MVNSNFGINHSNKPRFENQDIPYLKEALKKKTILLYLLSTFFFGCASSTVGNSHKNHLPFSKEAPSQNEQQEFHSIEDLFSQGMLESAATKAASFSKHYPQSSFSPSLENIRGLLSLKHKKFLQAAAHFKKAIELNHGNQAFIHYVYYNLATAQANSDNLDAALLTLNSIDSNALNKPNQVKVAYLKANIYSKTARPFEASRQLLTIGDLLTEADWQGGKGPYFTLLEETLQKVKDYPALEMLYHEFEQSRVADVLLYQLGAQAHLNGNITHSDLYLKALLLKFPQSTYCAAASKLLSSPPEKQLLTDDHVIGILLPIKGKFGKFGAKSLQGIELAFGIFDPTEKNSKFTLVIEDSGEEVEQALQALNRLVLKHHVAAVIGPMLSKGIDQISSRAQELGVPLISLARKSSSSTQDFVFQGGLTQQLQAHEVARHAIQDLGLKRFAMLYPSDKFGTEMSQYFWEAVEDFGGKMVAVEAYSPGETDFRKSVDRLSGLFYLDARQRELDLLSEEREANNIKSRSRKTEQFFNLKPIADYDAVFIPDEPKIAGQILPTFAYRDVEHIKFLGTSSWNSSEFLTRAQTYADKSTFVDAFFNESKKPNVMNFLKKYRSTFGQEPTSLEVLAYDAALVLKSTLLLPGQSSTRTEIKERLKSIKNFPGTTGEITFKDGQLFRNLLVITVKNGQFTDQ